MSRAIIRSAEDVNTAWLKWPRPWWLGAAALFAVLFGLLTLKEGGSVLFIDGEARRAAGHYVPFVVWFNFLAGFAYVVTGGGLWARRSWAVWLGVAIAVATTLAFFALGAHVYAGGAYEVRTVIAMSVRTLVWAAIAGLAWRLLQREMCHANR